MRLFRTILLLLFVVACDNKSENFSPEIIAHAGGEIDGFLYTNSREALEKSIADGYRYIEFDFQYTADSVLVAAHDWALFNTMTGHKHKGDSAPTFVDFSSRRIHGRYTPLSATDINELFENNAGTILVTDKVSSPLVLSHYFPRLKERMAVEAFSYDDYQSLLSQGYFRVFYSCLATDLNTALLKHLVLHPFFKEPKIEWVTMYIGEIDNFLFRVVNVLSSFKMALFTIDSYESVPPACRKKTKMIYTEKIKPSM